MGFALVLFCFFSTLFGSFVRCGSDFANGSMVPLAHPHSFATAGLNRSRRFGLRYEGK